MIEQLHQRLYEEFKTCKQHSYQLDQRPDLLKVYFPETSFDDARNKFFGIDVSEIQQLYEINYPFRASVLFDEDRFTEIIDLIPELVLSLIALGRPYLITLNKYNTSRARKPLETSLSSFTENSKLIHQCWDLLKSASSSVKADQESIVQTLNEKLMLFGKSTPYYDIRGVLQNVYNSIILMALSFRLDGFGRFSLILHPDTEKRNMLLALSGREISPIRTLKQIHAPEEIVDNLEERILWDIVQHGFPAINSPNQVYIGESIAEYVSGVPAQSIDSAAELLVDEELSTSESALAMKLSTLKTPLISRNKHFLAKLLRHQFYFESKMSILLLGETGTGKDVLANAIHELSGRKGKFVAINCANLHRGLDSSELFGHEKGAFTGAHQRRTGAIENADGGTLFLDEIGELPLDQQAMLLRVLESKSFSRLGASQEISVDIRIISSTNVDLEAFIKENTFREDLFHRLSGDVIMVPALSERGDDIQYIAEELFKRKAQEEGCTPPKSMTAETFTSLGDIEWPGNVRQLANHIHKVVVKYIHSRHTIGALKDILNGEEPQFEFEIDSIYSGLEEQELFRLYLSLQCNLTKTSRKSQTSRDTTRKKLYGIFVRLWSQFSSTVDIINFLESNNELHDDITQQFQSTFVEAIETLKSNYFQNNSLNRYLYAADENLFVAKMK